MSAQHNLAAYLKHWRFFMVLALIFLLNVSKDVVGCNDVVCGVKEKKIELQEEINTFTVMLEKLEPGKITTEAKKAFTIAQRYLNENDFDHAVFFLRKTFRLYKEITSQKRKLENIEVKLKKGGDISKYR